ncbi:MAG: urease accessory protein UreE [Acidobacteria bacterium]|nr:urease accessory protein UreE [Acidobacteriota bacterium]
MIRIESLPDTFEPPGETFETIRLPMNAVDRTRVRRRLLAPDGVELALALPTGTRLWPGQILCSGPGKLYVVEAAPEDVLVLRPRHLREAAFAAHLIGNMHRDIDLEGEGIAALYDDALANRLTRAGLDFTRERRPFIGSPNGEHVH